MLAHLLDESGALQGEEASRFGDDAFRLAQRLGDVAALQIGDERAQVDRAIIKADRRLEFGRRSGLVRGFD